MTNDNCDMNNVGSLNRDNKQKPKLVQSSPDGTVVSSSDTLPTPPDGGWGWMVVLGSFVLQAIRGGVTHSFGIFLVAFIEQFDACRGDVGWISSLMDGMTFCSGICNLIEIIDAFNSHHKVWIFWGRWVMLNVFLYNLLRH